jgi:hypothetical protein
VMEDSSAESPLGCRREPSPGDRSAATLLMTLGRRERERAAAVRDCRRGKRRHTWSRSLRLEPLSSGPRRATSPVERLEHERSAGRESSRGRRRGGWEGADHHNLGEI